jgi:hypothetical protein
MLSWRASTRRRAASCTSCVVDGAGGVLHRFPRRPVGAKRDVHGLQVGRAHLQVALHELLVELLGGDPVLDLRHFPLGGRARQVQLVQPPLRAADLQVVVPRAQEHVVGGIARRPRLVPRRAVVPLRQLRERAPEEPVQVAVPVADALPRPVAPVDPVEHLPEGGDAQAPDAESARLLHHVVGLAGGHHQLAGHLVGLQDELPVAQHRVRVVRGSYTTVTDAEDRVRRPGSGGHGE